MRRRRRSPRNARGSPAKDLAPTYSPPRAADGAWHRAGAPDWLPTLFTVQLLRATGVDPADPRVVSAVERSRTGFRWDEEFGAKPFFDGEVEPCINGGALAPGAYLGRPSESLARRLLAEQLEDGGWNCEAPKSTRSSYHTTICVLEGLARIRACGRRIAGECRGQAPRRGVPPGPQPVSAAIDRRARKSSVSDVRVPARYQYDVLRALDYFRAAGKPARSTDGRGAADRRRKSAAGRPVASRSRARRGACGAAAFWRVCRRPEPVEHAAGAARAPVVARP